MCIFLKITSSIVLKLLQLYPLSYSSTYPVVVHTSETVLEININQVKVDSRDLEDLEECAFFGSVISMNGGVVKAQQVLKY